MRRHHVAAASPHRLRASGDRWLFGYADVVTLMFACFASLYATTAQPDAMPARVEYEAPAPAARAPQISAERFPAFDITAAEHTITISLPEAGSFPPGGADLSASARTAILNLAPELRNGNATIRIEGHTDDIPIATDAFESNWALSTARATRVTRLLIEEGGIDPARLAAAGFAEFRPRVANTSAEARARNRRVDIVLLADDEVRR